MPLRAFVVTPERIAGVPEWPLFWARAVGLVRFALAHPDYVGRFRDHAFPAWWRRLTRELADR